MKTRRDILKLAALAPFMGSFPSLASAATPFAGKFVVTIQAVGAWDVTCFCDPKENQPDETYLSKFQY